jgi:hypothetical protein
VEVGDGLAEAPHEGEGTRGRGVRLSDEWMGRGGSVGRHGTRSVRAVGVGWAVVVPVRVEKIGEGEPLTGGAAWHSTGAQSNKFDSNSNLNGFELYSNAFKFECSRKNLPWLENFDLKYGCEVFEEINYFFHWNFSKFAMDFN